MSERPRLLYCVNQAAFFVSHFRHLAVAAREAGFDVSVAAPDGPGVDAIRGAGLTHVTFDLDRRGFDPRRELATIAAYRRLFRAHRPALVHTYTIKPTLYGGVAARLAGVPAFVSTITGLGYSFLTPGWRGVLRRRITLAAYRRALGGRRVTVIFENPDDQSLFVDARVVDADATTVIRGAGVDCEVFRPSPEPADGKTVMMLVARMLWDKGVGEFVAAAESLRREGSKARFVLVGAPDPGNPATIPADQLARWQASGVVEWWGERRDIPAVLAQANVVCLPSYREGLPKVLLEAAASGRAIVTADVTGCREVVRHGDNGLLVPVRAVAPLADALRQLSEDPARRAQMGQRGRERATTEFSESRVQDATLTLYRRMTGATPR